MSDLYAALRKRAGTNARAEVRAYARNLSEYQKAAQNSAGRADLMDCAVWLRVRTVELASADQPLADSDLATIADIGTRRARQGFSLDSARRVLTLHASLMLREIQAVTGPHDIEHLLRLSVWLGAQGAIGSGAYLRAHVAAQQDNLPLARRVRWLAGLMLSGDPAAATVAHSLGMCRYDHFLVVAFRTARPSYEVPDELVEAVFGRHRAPVDWQRPGELVALLPCRQSGTPPFGGPLDERCRSLVRDCADLLDQPCAIGLAAGPGTDLAATADLALRIAHAAPIQPVPRAAHDLSDVFVELAAAEVTAMDRLLRGLADRLALGPDLMVTLEAFYRNDMHRARTAESLHLHPRTLDYRLRRVRELVAMDPTAVRGIRLLTAVVGRQRGGAWD
jgi:hypothetical protein